MFSFIKKQLQKIYDTVTSKIQALFQQKSIDKQTLEELEKLLLTADTGTKTTQKLIAELQEKFKQGTLSSGKELQTALEEKLISALTFKSYDYTADILILVGINGSGKTTFAGKLGYAFAQQGTSVLFAAADTFRAAATEQLSLWADLCKAPIVKGAENQDPASVVYTACKQYLANGYQKLIIDTAGRLQTKVNLMKELEKITGIVRKLLPEKKISILLTVDSMLGQNSFNQATLFNESTHVDGLVVTKLDGTGKGGIVIAIAQELQIPVAYISYGEKIDALAPFNARSYILDIF
jgi:fused signal recognition particle receptor